MLGIPHDFMNQVAFRKDWSPLVPNHYAVGVLFSPKDEGDNQWAAGVH